jgi:cell division protein FtsA
MQNYDPTLFIEINNLEYVFGVGVRGENNHFELVYKDAVPNLGISNYKISDFDLIHNTIKKNIYLIEQRLNFTFKDVILILNVFHCSFINLTGYKKLNGSQILKENITYILNSLKSTIDDLEEQKKILHIFNSKYCLDNEKIENLPIGLFGNFYSHELSFSLIYKNDYKNLNNIFSKCNLKIKKILLKNFVEGTYLINKNQNLNTFFKIEINENSSKLFYFENYALKFSQNFNFGSNLILSDISKVTSLKKDKVSKILSNNILTQSTSDNEFIEKELFDNENYRKIKKKLIFEIAEARIQELSQIILIKNINLISFNKKNGTVILSLNDKSNMKCFEECYRQNFSKENYFKIKFIENTKSEDLLDNADHLVNFGWKKEVIPVIHAKKSLLAKFFDALFN